MRRITWAALLAVFATIGVLGQDPGVNAQLGSGDEAHTRWIEDVIRSISTIKPGMTRKDLLQLFREDGGLSSRVNGRYVYRHCPNIKVDVQFSPVDEGYSERNDLHPDDKMIKISRPYLEYPIFD